MDREEMRRRVLARLPKQQQRGTWFEIKAAVDDRAVVRIYDEISWWGVTADDFARELAQVSAAEIEVQINSPGGDAFDGVAIYNALRAHPARVTTRVDGLAASAASIIAQAGDHRMIMSSAQIMIHEAWGVAIGPATEMRSFADQLDKLNDTMARLYAARSGGGDGAVERFRELMAAETWFGDTEAVEAGLADEVFDPPRQDAPDGTTAGAASNELQEAVRAALGDLGVNLAALTRQTPAAPAEGPEPPDNTDLNQDAARAVLAAFDLQERETIDG